MQAEDTDSRTLPPCAPFPQQGRGRRECLTCTSCAYCGEAVEDHDHDHMPIPWRHGGREVIPACRRCHKLKDYGSLNRWAPAALVSAADGFAGSAVPLLRLLAGARTSPDFDLSIDRDTALAAVNDCTTTEARIAVATLIAFALDEQKRRSTQTHPADSGSPRASEDT